MGKSRAIGVGSIVWANISDRSGKNPKVRPLLVIPPKPINPAGVFSCLAISTDPQDDPSDPAVEMPWSSEDGSTTGLWEWSRVVVLWYVQLDRATIADHTGRVPQAVLDEVMSVRERARNFRFPKP